MNISHTTEYVPAERQMFVLNRSTYIGSLGTGKKPLNVGQALRLLNNLEINLLERTLGLNK